MGLEIHKAGNNARDVQIDISEVFPAHYKAPDKASVCETEAQALYDALKTSLPEETRAALKRMITLGGLE